MSSGTRSTPDTSFEEEKIIQELYTVSNYDPAWLKEVYDEFKYQGFNRQEILEKLSEMFGDYRLLAKIIIVCALRGPVRASMTVVDGKTLIEWGIPVRRKPGSSGVSCGRITSATADLAAYFLKKSNAPKRLNVDCPAWLQFPSAGSIDMPTEYRKMHIEFSKKFSDAIGGSFKEEIYIQMEANAYIDPTLRLFE